MSNRTTNSLKHVGRHIKPRTPETSSLLFNFSLFHFIPGPLCGGLGRAGFGPGFGHGDGFGHGGGVGHGVGVGHGDGISHGAGFGAGHGVGAFRSGLGFGRGMYMDVKCTG